MFQTSVSLLESKQRQSNSEVAELQAKVGEYERLLEDNRNQVCCLLLCLCLWFQLGVTQLNCYLPDCFERMIFTACSGTFLQCVVGRAVECWANNSVKNEPILTGLCSATTCGDNMALPALVATAAQSIDIFCLLGPQQQTAAVACGGWMGQTDGQTDARQLHRPCSTYYVGSANNFDI